MKLVKFSLVKAKIFSQGGLKLILLIIINSKMKKIIIKF